MGMATTPMSCGYCGECATCIDRAQRGSRLAHEAMESAKRIKRWGARRDVYWRGIVARIMGGENGTE